GVWKRPRRQWSLRSRVRMPLGPARHSRYGATRATAMTQRPHDTSSGGISLASSLAEALRKLKNRPATIARKKPRVTREGMRRDSESGASRAGADIASGLAPRAGDGQAGGFAGAAVAVCFMGCFQ